MLRWLETTLVIIALVVLIIALVVTLDGLRKCRSILQRRVDRGGLRPPMVQVPSYKHLSVNMAHSVGATTAPGGILLDASTFGIEMRRPDPAHLV